MGSKLIVEIVKIDNIESHPNADRLEIATVKGWQCIVPKGIHRKGEVGLYIPIDSIIPFKLEERIFGLDSKVKLSKGRIKTIRLRGAISQGLLIHPLTAGLVGSYGIGSDVAEELGITKHEPPVKHQQNLTGGFKAPAKTNTHFHKYTSLQNVKNYMNVFKKGEIVSVTEKIHGTNFRAGYVPRENMTLLDKFLIAIGLKTNYEFVYGSHNVQLQYKAGAKSESTNVYLEAVKKYDLENRLMPGEVVYGEVYGYNIQKNYDYGCKENERKLVIFDVMLEGEYFTPGEMDFFCEMRNIPTPPEIYRGVFDFELIKAKLKGSSVMVPGQKTIEGGVCKPVVRTPSHIGRKVLKFINDDYLLKDNTDYH